MKPARGKHGGAMLEKKAKKPTEREGDRRIGAVRPSFGPKKTQKKPTKREGGRRKGGGTSFGPKPKMRRFTSEFIVTMEVSQALIDAVLTDEWRSHFYNLQTPEDVAAHLAYNFMRDVPMSLLDGFAGQPEGAARMVGRPDSGDTREWEKVR